jgi:hypothetical protein
MTVMNTYVNGSWGGEVDRTITQFHSAPRPINFTISFNAAIGFTITYQGVVIAIFPNRLNISNANIFRITTSSPKIQISSLSTVLPDAAEAERQRLAAAEAERQRLAAAEAERQRLAAAEAERQRLAAAEAERQRLAAAEAERQRLAAADAKWCDFYSQRGGRVRGFGKCSSEYS